MTILISLRRQVLAQMFLCAILCPQALSADTPTVILESIARAYTIEITTNPAFPVPTMHGPITGNAVAVGDLVVYVPLFAAEFTLYPKTLIQRANLKQIVFCTDLSFAGQRRNAIPDFEHDTLYLDVGRGAYSKQYQRKVIHHEFFHMIDLKDDGELYQDPCWSSLNSPTFQYLTGGKDAQAEAETSVLTDRFPGFLNHYSTTGVEEDKAELFANLLVEPAYVEKRVKDDTTLKVKVERLKDLVERFCPDMDEAFWKKAADTQRGPG